MAANTAYAFFDDVDAEDTSSEEVEITKSDDEKGQAEEGKEPDISCIQVPIVDGTGGFGGFTGPGSYKDLAYEGPTISGLGVPGCAAWTSEGGFADNHGADKRKQAKRELEEAAKRRDPFECAESLVQLERLGMDTSTPTGQLALSVADPKYLQMLQEAQQKQAEETQWKDFMESAQSEGLDSQEVGEQEQLPAEGIEDTSQTVFFPVDHQGEAKQQAVAGSPSAAVFVPRRHRESKAAAGKGTRSRRRKSPTLAEKLLLGANVRPTSSTEEDSDEEGETVHFSQGGEGEVAAGDDPDLQFVGVWCYGPGAAERVRVSRPERGLLLVDALLPNGSGVSGMLQPSQRAGVREAKLVAKDAQPAGAMRVRPVDAAHLALGVRLHGEADWPAEVIAERVTLWVCCPPERRPIGIRQEPEFDAARTGKVLRHGEVFAASAERTSTQEDVRWLHLQDGRGWVFDRQPGAASLCVRWGEPISSFSMLDGYMQPGGEIHYEELTLEEAKIRCAALPDCAGYCFEGSPGTRGPIGVLFKNRWQLGGAGEATGWTSVRVEYSQGHASRSQELAMTPAEEEEARQWYDSVSQGWLTRLKPEGANEGGINALEDILASMDRCDVAEDPEVREVRTSLERVKDVGCTALTPVTSEDLSLVPPGKLTSHLRPYSAKEGDDQTDPNAAVGKLCGPQWVSEFRKHHPAARVSPGLTLHVLTGQLEADEAATGTEGRLQRSQDLTTVAEDGSESVGREEPWWEDKDMEVSEAPSLEVRAALVAPVRPVPKARPKERSRMAMPKNRPLTASANPGRSGIPLSGAASSSSASNELGSDLSGLFF